MTWKMKAESDAGDYEQPAAGAHAAVLVRIVDLGTHLDSSPQYGDRWRRSVVFTWELGPPMMTDGRPYTVSGWYTLSMNPKAKLRQMLESWRGRAYKDEDEVDVAASLGKPCMLTIVHSTHGKARVGAVAALPQGMQAPKPHAELLSYHIDSHNPDAFARLPEWMTERIATSRERLQERQSTMPGAVRTPQPAPPMDVRPPRDTPPQDFDDDIPF